MTRWFALLVVVAGCDRVLGLDDVNAPGKGGDAGSNTGPDAPLACTPRLDTLHDDFSGAIACAPWGASYTHGGATIAQANHAVTITGNAGGTSYAGCDSSTGTPLEAEGIFVEVSQHFTGMYGYTVFSLDLTQSSVVQLDIDAGGTIQLENHDGSTTYGTPATYDEVAMRFLRIRPNVEKTALVGEVSPDAIRWTAIADTGTGVAVPATVGITLIAGNDDNGDGSTGQFSHLNVCP